MMRLSSQIGKTQTVWVIGLLSAATLVGCSGVPLGSSDEMATQELESIATAESAPTAATDADRSSAMPTGDIPTSSIPTGNLPTDSFQTDIELIKHASLQVAVDDMDVAIAAISDTLAQVQGDLLQLSDLDRQSSERRQMSLQLRVPQDNLDAALESLRNLGTVETQAISADDVSNQLVDLQARIRNLRKSEESLLEIMERSGSIGDVLEVSRELSTVREAIERHAAQLQSLQNRVAYSTISLTLVSNTPPTPPVDPVGQTLSQTWQTASTSMQALGVGLLQLLLWLLAFSPYLGILVLSGWIGRRYWQRQRSPETPAN